MTKTSKYTTLNLLTTADYPKTITLRNKLRKKYGLSTLSLREAVMIAVNNEIERINVKGSNHE